MTLKKCLFSNIRLECGLRLAPLRMQERNLFVLRFRGGAVCDTATTTEGSSLARSGAARSGHSAAQVRIAHNGRGRRWSRPHAR